MNTFDFTDLANFDETTDRKDLSKRIQDIDAVITELQKIRNSAVRFSHIAYRRDRALRADHN